MRLLSYAEAIREGHAQLLARDPRVFLIGQGLWSPWYAGGSLENLDCEFGRERLLDSPIAENAVTGLGIGAAVVFAGTALASAANAAQPTRSHPPAAARASTTSGVKATTVTVPPIK